MSLKPLQIAKCKSIFLASNKEHKQASIVMGMLWFVCDTDTIKHHKPREHPSYNND